jgi:hypothetical protein
MQPQQLAFGGAAQGLQNNNPTVGMDDDAPDAQDDNNVDMLAAADMIAQGNYVA